jgi:hypothetical protein
MVDRCQHKGIGMAIFLFIGVAKLASTVVWLRVDERDHNRGRSGEGTGVTKSKCSSWGQMCLNRRGLLLLSSVKVG